jgi:hypothetical protein
MGKGVRSKIQQMTPKEKKAYAATKADCRRRERVAESMLTFLGG